MAKYKSKIAPVRKDKVSAEDLKQEKKFFMTAILITIAIVLLIYFIYSRL